jgi:hypothetical protein
MGLIEYNSKYYTSTSASLREKVIQRRNPPAVRCFLLSDNLSTLIFVPSQNLETAPYTF